MATHEDPLDLPRVGSEYLFSAPASLPDVSLLLDDWQVDNALLGDPTLLPPGETLTPDPLTNDALTADATPFPDDPPSVSRSLGAATPPPVAAAPAFKPIGRPLNSPMLLSRSPAPASPPLTPPGGFPASYPLAPASDQSLISFSSSRPAPMSAFQVVPECLPSPLPALFDPNRASAGPLSLALFGDAPPAMLPSPQPRHTAPRAHAPSMREPASYFPFVAQPLPDAAPVFPPPDTFDAAVPTPDDLPTFPAGENVVDDSSAVASSSAVDEQSAALMQLLSAPSAPPPVLMAQPMALADIQIKPEEPQEPLFQPQKHQIQPQKHQIQPQNHSQNHQTHAQPPRRRVLDKNERRSLKRMRNRVSASRCRDRKRVWLHDLQDALQATQEYQAAVEARTKYLKAACRRGVAIMEASRRATF